METFRYKIEPIEKFFYKQNLEYFTMAHHINQIL
jgi:hypothetical protein